MSEEPVLAIRGLVLPAVLLVIALVACSIVYQDSRKDDRKSEDYRAQLDTCVRMQPVYADEGGSIDDLNNCMLTIVREP